MWGLVLNRYFLVAMGAAILTMLLVKKRREDSDFASNSIPSDADPGVTPSISHEKAKSHAQALFDAMDKPGTDEDKIEAVVFSVNAADWKMIDEAFGTKNYDPILGVYGDLWGRSRPLSTWLRGELSKTWNKTILDRIQLLYRLNGVSF